MAESNSMVLLPPRASAQVPQKSASVKPKASPSHATSFGKKLETAKSLKAQSPAKKQIAPEPAKPQAVVAKPTSKPQTQKETAEHESTEHDATEHEDAENSASQKLVRQNQSAQDKAVDAEADAQTEAHEQPKLTVLAQQADAAAEKKPVKGQKPAAAAVKKTNSANPELTQKAAALKAAAATAAASNGVAGHTSVSADDDKTDHASTDAKGNSTDAIAANTTAEFGTGKIAGKSGAGSNDPSASPADDVASAAALTTAVAASASAPAVIAAAVGGSAAVKLVSGNGDPLAEPASQIAGVGGITSTGGAVAIGGKPAVAPTPQAQFVEDNSSKIVSSIQGQLMPHGGTMQIRLDPPELGPLSVTVNMKDGVMTATFQASNDEATKLLSHSLSQLKSGLEAAGMSVDKLHVEPTSKNNSSSSSDSDSDSKQSTQQQSQSQQDQQRREMVQRMWRKLAGGGDPLDLVA